MLVTQSGNSAARDASWSFRRRLWQLTARDPRKQGGRGQDRCARTITPGRVVEIAEVKTRGESCRERTATFRRGIGGRRKRMAKFLRRSRCHAARGDRIKQRDVRSCTKTTSNAPGMSIALSRRKPPTCGASAPRYERASKLKAPTRSTSQFIHRCSLVRRGVRMRRESSCLEVRRLRGRWGASTGANLPDPAIDSLCHLARQSLKCFALVGEQ